VLFGGIFKFAPPQIGVAGGNFKFLSGYPYQVAHHFKEL
jgi:hypothetical protein